MKTKNFYIGVVGQIASGKGVLVDYLVKKYGFIPFSLSTIVHEEVKKRGIKNYDRKILQDVGDELRKKYGRDILAKRAVKTLNSKSKIQSNPPASRKNSKLKNFLYWPKFIIEGIRNPAEVEYLKKIPNFILIGVKAKRRLRFERLIKRRRDWDPKTWEEFLKVDRRDLGVGQREEGQQVGRCLPYCDYVLTNNKEIWDFHRKVKKLMEKIFKG